MDLEYINNLAALVYEYRKAVHMYREASKDDTSDAAVSAANNGVTRAANKLLAFAKEED